MILLPKDFLNILISQEARFHHKVQDAITYSLDYRLVFSLSCLFSYNKYIVSQQCKYKLHNVTFLLTASQCFVFHWIQNDIHNSFSGLHILYRPSFISQYSPHCTTSPMYSMFQDVSYLLLLDILFPLSRMHLSQIPTFSSGPNFNVMSSWSFP